MKKIGFVGAYDKTDFIIYVAKILTESGKRVLVVDNTTMQKARYVVPVINPTKAYITEYEKIDVSIGLKNFEEIKKYLCVPVEKKLEYDYVLIDVDKIEVFDDFNMYESFKNYFVTSFDLYSLKKGLEILNDLSEPINLTKIIFSRDILKEEDDYLNYLALGKKAIWNDLFSVYFPIDNGDQSIIYENQRVNKIGIRKLSSQYKESLYYIAEDILENDVSSRKNKKCIEKFRKGSVENGHYNILEQYK